MSETYFAEIESFFGQRRGAFRMLSPADFRLAESWQERGVPLEVVLRGIDLAFGRARQRVNALAYCAGAVDEVLEEYKATQVARPAPSSAAGGQSPEEVRRCLGELADRISAASLPLGRTFVESIGAAVRGLDPAASVLVLDDLLRVQENHLVAALEGADGQALLEVQLQASIEIAPLRVRMTADQLSAMGRQLVRRKLLERYGLPRLSLFHLM